MTDMYVATTLGFALIECLTEFLIDEISAPLSCVMD